MQRLSIVILMSATLGATSGCATRKYVRNTVNTSADTLSARIDTNDGEIKEVRDDVDKKVSGVDTKVSALDARTTEGMNSLKGDVQNASQSASQAQSSADRAASNVNALDEKFQNRNQYSSSDEKTVQFKFNSATLDKEYMNTLDEIAASLMQNPDAILVLEGRTDSKGTKDYNMKLGERRIDAVKHYLVVEKGVPIFKIHEISFGADKPVAENNTREGREKNRAVVMTVMLPKGAASVASRNN
jgi:outer membrane protein OmpA-like peptidoglycan-associated protein